MDSETLSMLANLSLEHLKDVFIRESVSFETLRNLSNADYYTRVVIIYSTDILEPLNQYLRKFVN